MRGKSCVEDGETSWRAGTAGEDGVLKWALLGDGEVVGAVVIQCDGFTGHQGGAGNHGRSCEMTNM